MRVRLTYALLERSPFWDTPSCVSIKKTALAVRDRPIAPSGSCGASLTAGAPHAKALTKCQSLTLFSRDTINTNPNHILMWCMAYIRWERCVFDHQISFHNNRHQNHD